jgi:hypothetical protein
MASWNDDPKKHSRFLLQLQRFICKAPSMQNILAFLLGNSNDCYLACKRTSLKSWETVPYNQCSVHSGACGAILQQEIRWFDQDKNTTVAWWPLMIISGCNSGTGIAVVN